MTVAVADGPNTSVVARLYLHTKTLHVEAERSGVISDMLRGNATREGYILLMRNLLPAYQELEQGLERHITSPSLSEIASYRLDRASAIKSDLDALAGGGWADRIPLLEAGQAYAKRIAEAAKGNGSKLIGHAYARYLGDLSGGLILQKLLAKTLDLKSSEMAFYNFSAYSDLGLLKSNYRSALDRAATVASDHEAILEEGATAFTLNIDLSWAVKNAIAATQPV